MLVMTPPYRAAAWRNGQQIEHFFSRVADAIAWIAGSDQGRAVSLCSFAHCWHASRRAVLLRVFAVVAPNRVHVSCCRCNASRIEAHR